jgi:peptide/nickel transport system permease protein
MRWARGLARFFGRRHWSFALGVGMLGALATALALAPWIMPYDPTAQDLAHRLADPSALHWLGTDHLGRDELSRLLEGGRFSVIIAAVTLALCAAIGILLGTIGARTGGMFDEVLMRTVDLLISFPDVIVALLLVAFLGPGYGTLILALTAVGWTPFARMMRAQTMLIGAQDYIRAAEVLGCGAGFIVARHIIPNAIRPVLAMAFLRFGHKLIAVGGLSFLGLGVQPPGSDWGAMLGDGRRFMEAHPLLVLAPGLAIFVTALSVTLIGQRMEIVHRRRRNADGPGAVPGPVPSPVPSPAAAGSGA